MGFELNVPLDLLGKLEILAKEQKIFKRPIVAFEKLCTIVHIIASKQAYLHTGKGVDGLPLRLSDYKGARINRDVLTGILCTNKKNTSALVKLLIKDKIIKRIGGYDRGVGSYRYSLTFIPEEDAIVKLKGITGNCIKKMKNFLNDTVNDKDLKVYEPFLRRLKLNIAPIDIIKKIKGEYCTGKVIKSNMRAADSIERGDWHLHRPDKKSRVYTNITNLKRELRPYLEYEGKPMIEFDIRNSQPLISYIVIRNYLIREGNGIPEDLAEYKSNCENGTFYDYFMELNKVTDEKRKEFKLQFFEKVFFSRVTKRRTKIRKQFEERYPNCFRAICAIKGQMGTDEYKQFAIRLQREEAGLIFDRINLELLYEEIPAFNIFDSILCLPEHKDIVEKKIIDVFSSINIKPKLNFTDYRTINKKL